jgi:hypothetical protein
MNRHFFRLIQLVILLTIVRSTLSSGYAEEIILENKSGVKLIIPKTTDGYVFGTLYLNDKPIEKSLLKGMLLFKDTEKNKDIWLYASETKTISNLKCQFSGKGSIVGADVTFNLTIELPENIKALNLIYDFNVDRDIQNRQACLMFNSDFKYDWKCHMYPWAADARYIQRDPLSWMGVPSLILYRDDMSLGMMWGIDPDSDYLNPTSWTKDFGLYFINRQVPAQYRVGGKELKSGIDYHCPMQLILSDNNDPDLMITDLVQSWIEHNNYQVEELHVRSNDEALKLFMHGRKNTSMWYPSQGYRLEMGDPSSAFIYIGEQGLSALFEYILYELTGDAEWRKRSFEQMDFILTGQNNNLEDPLYGYIHTAFSLVDYGPAGKGFNSYDRGSNPGYKIDINIYLGRYMLHMWQRVKIHEGIDRKDWHNAALKAIDWAVSQQNSDGGLPQKLSFVPLEFRKGNDWMGTAQPDFVKFKGPGEKSISATSTRALPALWHIYKITGNEKYKQIMEEVEAYTLSSFQNKYLFNSHHPDLPPHTLEEGGIWGICEYWLYRYEETKDKKYLKHAVANTHLSLTWKCPKQLSWVENPTQLGSAEQQYFLQYSVYCYQNRQVECLKKLYKYTKNSMYDQLAERITQNIFWTQLAEGDLMGATHERIADPWLARNDGDGPGVNTMGTIYMSEQSLDLLLQTVEMYRTGKFICKDKNVANKSYSDGVVYYSEDNRGKEMVDLQIAPSKGFVNSVVESWDDKEKIWMLSGASEIKTTINHKIGSLNPGHTFQVSVGGKKIGSYQVNQEGEIIFSYTGNFTIETEVILINKN